MGLIEKIKADVKKAGQNKGKFIFFPEGNKRRIRFITDLDDGMEVTFHDSFAKNINVPCQDVFGRACPYCEDEELRTRSQYVWTVYDVEENEVRLLMEPVNNWSPVPQLMAMYENYGTITDRDYVITRTGKGTNKSFTVIPMDKAKFRNDKVKPFSNQKVLEIIDNAYPSDAVGEGATPKPKDYGNDDVDDEETALPWDGKSGATIYQSSTPKELYTMCKERNIEAEPRKNSQYYITLLEEADKAEDDWGDDDDEWEDE